MSILSGLKVLDFTTLLPGPFATMMLADMGAEVVKVESPKREDFVKHMEPKDSDVSATFAQLQRSKRSLALDLKDDRAKEIIYQLVKEYDIVVEQFRPGVMERLGIGYDKLKEINPRIIFCSITGYGQTGPYKNKAGHDINFLSIAGIAGYSARKQEPPVPAGIQIADLAGGSMPAVIGILAAVYHREQTGEGQYIDLSMTDAAFSLNAMYGPASLAGGAEPEPEELLLNGGTFYDYYETADGRFLSVGSLEPKFQARLCELIGAKELIDLCRSSLPVDQQSFKRELASAIKQKTFHEWMELLGEDFDGCVEPVLHFSEAAKHPQIEARNLIVPVPQKTGGYLKQIAFPIKFSTEQAKYQFAGVQTGFHTEEILRETGLNQEEIEMLANKGIIGSPGKD